MHVCGQCLSVIVYIIDSLWLICQTLFVGFDWISPELQVTDRNHAVHIYNFIFPVKSWDTKRILSWAAIQGPCLLPRLKEIEEITKVAAEAKHYIYFSSQISKQKN